MYYYYYYYYYYCAFPLCYRQFSFKGKEEKNYEDWKEPRPKEGNEIRKDLMKGIKEEKDRRNERKK
jgi:hypothetical protein